MAYPLSASAQAWHTKARACVVWRLRMDRMGGGTSDIQRLIIARSVLKRGVDGVIGR